jgi:hypothetical protein
LEADVFKIEIFEKATGRVVDTKDFKTVRGVKDWNFWWERQGDKKNYSWRQVASD